MECGLREVSAIWKAPLLNSCICLLRYFSWFWNIFVPGRDLGRAGGICRAKSAIWDAPKLQFVRNKQSQESCVLQLTFLYLCICTFVFVIWDASELQFVGNQQSQECSITHQGGLGLGMNPFIVKFNWRQYFPFALCCRNMIGTCAFVYFVFVYLCQQTRQARAAQVWILLEIASGEVAGKLIIEFHKVGFHKVYLISNTSVLNS